MHRYYYQKIVKCECCGKKKHYYNYLHHKKSKIYQRNMNLPVFNLSQNKFIDSIVYKECPIASTESKEDTKLD
jgi:hypothetical protein